MASSRKFAPISLEAAYNRTIVQLTEEHCDETIVGLRSHMLAGRQSLWGIPFTLGEETGACNVLHVRDGTVRVPLAQPVNAPYVVFLHAADRERAPRQTDGLYAHPMMGEPRLGEAVCEYVLEYGDGTSHAIPIRKRFQINEFIVAWGEGGFECVPHLKPRSIETASDDILRGRIPSHMWGHSQYRLTGSRGAVLNHWLFAMENPHPHKAVVALSFVPGGGNVFVFGVAAGFVQSNPLRWETRRKALFRLPEGRGKEAADSPDPQLAIDLGQVISVLPARRYEHGRWETGCLHEAPDVSRGEYVVEYAAHPEGCLYIDGMEEPVALANLPSHPSFTLVPEASRRVSVRVVDQQTGKEIPVKIHVHGEYGEYLAPVNRHRIPNAHWFEDYGTDHAEQHHWSTYIQGRASYKLPLGNIYVEVSKGFEYRPVKKAIDIGPDTSEIVIPLENALNWRARGWVTADTHVHFLSPHTALLEGEAEGVHVINLLASQWGEMFSNIGDFDGKTTIGSKEAGGTGEYLVRVGTENRQNILGHISLIGYEGDMIVPLGSGGPDESALGDPLEVTLTEWAEQCRRQNGIAVLPHFPRPRAEGAASLVLEQIDGIEMCSLHHVDYGINPYSLSDWYRYLNCGYHVPVVGGTDKMSAATAVGTIRTYSLAADEPFAYEAWMNSVRKGNTFVTFGPLIDFRIEGKPAGSAIRMAGGGAVNVRWEVASVTLPVTKIEVVANGVVREEVSVDPALGTYAGALSLHVADSCWIALRVRGRYPGKSEVIAAHTSAILCTVDGKTCLQTADALTILDQLEGSMAYVRTLASRAEERKYKKIIMILNSAYRALHNRMHQRGMYHRHNGLNDHHHQ